VGRSWRGQWWLPERESQAVGGELHLDADEFVLTLDGEFTLPRPRLKGGLRSLFLPVHERVIFGRARDGERLTLLDCDGSISVIPARRDTSHWFPTTSLVGEKIDERGTLQFAAARREFVHLLAWSRAGGISTSFTVEGPAHRPMRVGIEAERSVAAKAQVRRSQLELVVYPSFHSDARKADIAMHAALQVTFAQPLSHSDAIRQWVQPLSDLISFATVRSARREGIYVRIGVDDPRARWVELLQRWVDLDVSPSTERTLIPQDMLFLADDLPGGFGPGVRKWLDLRDRLAASIELLLGVDYVPYLVSDQRFLALAQAAEIYHAIAFDGQPKGRAEHRAAVRAVTRTIEDAELRAWARKS
jgi:ApeA N-terminal domain 1